MLPSGAEAAFAATTGVPEEFSPESRETAEALRGSEGSCGSSLVAGALAEALTHVAEGFGAVSGRAARGVAGRRAAVTAYVAGDAEMADNVRRLAAAGAPVPAAPGAGPR